MEQPEQSGQGGNPDPKALLGDLHKKGAGLSFDVAAEYLAQVREDRNQWRGR